MSVSDLTHEMKYFGILELVKLFKVITYKRIRFTSYETEMAKTFISDGLKSLVVGPILRAMRSQAQVSKEG